MLRTNGAQCGRQIDGEGNLRAQLERVFANLELAVRKVGGSMNDTIKLNHFYTERVDSRMFGRSEKCAAVMVRMCKSRPVQIDGRRVSKYSAKSHLLHLPAVLKKSGY